MALVLCVSMLPATALAEEAAVTEQKHNKSVSSGNAENTSSGQQENSDQTPQNGEVGRC